MEGLNRNMTALISLVKQLSETSSQNARIIEKQTKLIEEQADKIEEQRKRISRNEKQIFLLMEKCKVLQSKIENRIVVE